MIESRTLRDAWLDPAEPAHVRLLTIIYWRTVVVVAACAVVAVAVGGYLQLQYTLALFNATTPTAKPAAVFDKAAFDAVVDGFQTRQLRYDALKAVPLTVEDPSQ